jgi:hypothetical protein
MKIFYDIKENLLKWLFFKEDNLCGFSFLRFLRGAASLLISAYFNFLDRIKTALPSQLFCLLLVWCFLEVGVGSRMVWGTCTHL